MGAVARLPGLWPAAACGVRLAPLLGLALRLLDRQGDEPFAELLELPVVRYLGLDPLHVLRLDVVGAAALLERVAQLGVPPPAPPARPPLDGQVARAHVAERGDGAFCRVDPRGEEFSAFHVDIFSCFPVQYCTT